MITKNIFKIHPFFYLVGLICFLTGNFKDFTIFSSIIIIHELGHIIGALLFKWNIEKVILLPFGGITIFNESLNKPLKEELIITLLGPIFQVLFYFVIGKQNPIFTFYNTAILLFNLLPIVPLDGSKIISIFSNKLTSFYKSGYITLLFSIFTWLIVIMFAFNYNVIYALILLFLLVEIVKVLLKNKYYFNKFLLERYLYNFKFNKEKIVSNTKQMKKGIRHLFYIDNKYFTEKEILRKMFDK